MDRLAAEKALVRIAQTSANAWRSVRGEAFAGETTIETANTLYRFKDGVFSGRAPKPAPGQMPAWESPPSMATLELIGFLSNEGGLWSLTPHWREGSLAVMWRINALCDPFTMTSPTLAYSVEKPKPVSSRRSLALPDHEEVIAVSFTSPRVRRPSPASTTRMQSAPMRRAV